LDTSLTYSKMIIAFLFLTGLVFGQAPSSFENTEITLSANEVLNIQAAPFLAKGDGVTDDRPAIQRAIDSGNVIYLPKAAVAYKITAPLILSEGKTIYGDGAGTIIRQTVAGQKGVLLGNNTVLRNFALRGTASGVWEPGATGIYATWFGDFRGHNGLFRTSADSEWQGKNVVIEDMAIYDWGQYGISAGPYNKIVHNRIYNCFHEGVYSRGDFTEITDNYIENTNSWGIDINGCYNLIRGNILINVGDRVALGSNDCGGIVLWADTQIDGMRGNIISGNLIHTSTTSGIVLLTYTYPLQQCTIEGNIIYNVTTNTTDAGLAGIYVSNEAASDKISSIIISNNNISQVITGPGIRVYGTGGVSIIGNMIDSTKTCGIFVLGSTFRASGVRIKDNDINNFGESQGIYVAYTDNVSITGNHITGTTSTLGNLLIFLSDDRNYILTDNILKGDTIQTFNGIRIVDGSSYGIVSHNTINNCRRGIYVDSSSTVGHLILTENGGTGTLDLPPEK